jgi:hypothetical protein
VLVGELLTGVVGSDETSPLAVDGFVVLVVEQFVVQFE